MSSAASSSSVVEPGLLSANALFHPHTANQPHHASNEAWNIYRRAADFLHMVGTLILVFLILKNQHCKGLSFKTQLCWALVFISRYLDLGDNIAGYQSPEAAQETRDHLLYLILFKIMYIGCQILILGCFWSFEKRKPGSVYEAHKDTFRMAPVFVACGVLAVFTPNFYTVKEVAWTFSHYLEGFAMVPQYVFIYRHDRRSLRQERVLGVDSYIFCVGAYKSLYACNWLYKYWMSRFSVTFYTPTFLCSKSKDSPDTIFKFEAPDQ